MSNFNDMFTGINIPEQKERSKEDIDAFVAESKENRQKCYTMADEMAMKVADDPGFFKLYLDVQADFSRYSLNNALLLAEQLPEAKQIGDLKYWREHKTFIKKEEFDQPLLILEPGDEYKREDGSIGTYYNAKKVYDVSQTKNGHHKENSNYYDINTLCMALASKAPVEFKSLPPEQMPEGYAVMYDANSNKIYMQNNLNDGNTVFQLTTMEIAHAIMAQDNPQYNHDDAHATAYAASYLLCKQFGVPTTGYEIDFTPHVENKEPQDIKKELGKIKTVADNIANRMEPSLDRNKAQKEKSYER